MVASYVMKVAKKLGYQLVFRYDDSPSVGPTFLHIEMVAWMDTTAWSI